MTINLNPLIEMTRRTVESHRVAEGQYSRWLWQNEKGDRDLGVSEYGCADAANLLYTIGDFVQDPAKRA